MLTLLFLFLLLLTARIIYFGLKTKFDGKKTVAFSKSVEKSTSKILCVGDSLGVGVGASLPINSLVGNISKDFPAYNIVNYSKYGARVGDLFAHIQKQKLETYDAIFVIVGGMDVIKMTSEKKLKTSLEKCVHFLAFHTKNIILIPPNNTGFLPLYHFPLREILNWRVKKVQKVFREVAKTTSCILADESIEELLKDKKKYFASDKSHPNDLGYALWYEKIRKSLPRIL